MSEKYPAHTCIEVIHTEIAARWALPIDEAVRVELVKTVAAEVFDSYFEGSEFVGAMGGLKYDVIRKEWS